MKRLIVPLLQQTGSVLLDRLVLKATLVAGTRLVTAFFPPPLEDQSLLPKSST
jgi:hypothetical protein